MKAGDGPDCGVKIPARRIHSEGPTGGPGLLPCGKRQCVLEEPRDEDTVERRGSDVTWLQPVRSRNGSAAGQYIPPIPPAPGADASFFSSGISATSASVVSRSDAIDAEF